MIPTLNDFNEHRPFNLVSILYHYSEANLFSGDSLYSFRSTVWQVELFKLFVSVLGTARTHFSYVILRDRLVVRHSRVMYCVIKRFVRL